MATRQSPFLATEAQGIAAEDSEGVAEPIHEDVSDGLTFTRSKSWFCPTYTRKDCRCGFCSIGDPDPCPYARPASESVIGSVLSASRRSLSRMLSARETPKDA